MAVVTFFGLQADSQPLPDVATEDSIAEVDHPNTPVKKQVEKALVAETVTPMNKAKKGRRVGQKDWPFSERLRLLDWAVANGHIARQKDFWFNANPRGARALQIPWETLQPHIHVDTLLDWARAADCQNWRGMVAEYGKEWANKKSRVPNSWRQVLKDTEGGDMTMLGQPALLSKHPDLLDTLCHVDAMHKEERDLLEPATATGFHDTLQTELDIKKGDAPDAAALPPKVSRSWVQLRLKDLRAKEVKHPCNEASTVSKEDEKSY